MDERRWDGFIFRATGAGRKGHDCRALRPKELLRRRDAAAFIRFERRIETLMQLANSRPSRLIIN